MQVVLQVSVVTRMNCDSSILTLHYNANNTNVSQMQQKQQTVVS